MRTLGQTPQVWLTKQRHQLAIELLRKGSPVKETAALVAYRHATTFSREFKKCTGQCPRAMAQQRRVGPPPPQNVT